MNKNIILLNKPAGFTPLQTIQVFRQKYPDYQNTLLSYAGRLDPMAEGLLLILVGAENKRREHYLNLPKTYEFEILAGVSTDTYDVMGMITQTSTQWVEELPIISGVINLPYPPYSSKTVNGKPLYWYANNNLLSTINIPCRQMTVMQFTVDDRYTRTYDEIYTSIVTRIATVQGDFRQQDIMTQWRSYVKTRSPSTMHVYRCTAVVTTGTYIRSLIHELSARVGVPLLAYSIKRTAIGPYHL